jgi:hypothetical protein
MRRSYRRVGTAAASLAAAMATVAVVSGTASADPTAKAKYQDALRAAASQNVHYVWRATEQGKSWTLTVDTGKTSGSQALDVRSGATNEELAVLRVGSTGYLRGNAAALTEALGLSAAESKTYADRWLSFPTGNATLSEFVRGLLDSDVAAELQMTGPYTLGGTKVIAGQLAQAIEGTASTSSGTKVPIVLYVNATGTPHPVREITNPDAKSSAIRGTMTFSAWGETKDPRAPAKSVPLIPLLPAG